MPNSRIVEVASSRVGDNESVAVCQSARGLARSKTLARTMMASTNAKRLGVRAALRRFFPAGLRQL